MRHSISAVEQGSTGKKQKRPGTFCSFESEEPVNVLLPQVAAIVEAAEVAGSPRLPQRPVQREPVPALPCGGRLLLLLTEQPNRNLHTFMQVAAPADGGGERAAHLHFHARSGERIGHQGTESATIGRCFIKTPFLQTKKEPLFV